MVKSVCVKSCWCILLVELILVALILKLDEEGYEKSCEAFAVACQVSIRCLRA